jgi:hypothetical protein
MTLTVLKHGGTWDFLATPFKIKAPTFEKLVTGFFWRQNCTSKKNTVIFEFTQYKFKKQ